MSIYKLELNCTVIVMGWWILSPVIPSFCLKARAGYSLDKSPAHHRALTDEQCGVQYLSQGHFDKLKPYQIANRV